LAKHLSITGVVQGVGYRYAFRTEARALKLSGWVRNRVDGSVEATVSGESAALDRIIDWSRHGPPGARVREVSIADADDAAVADGTFKILPTE
jgi:acylphosphatase